MAKYEVELKMSEKYVIDANTKEEAEKMALEKFGCTYYVDEIITTLSTPYEFECNMTAEYRKHTSIDEWGCAYLWLSDSCSVEYNFCIDGNNCSAIYKMEMNEDGCMETDHCTFEHYEIDFDDVNWQKSLETAMYEAAKKFFSGNDTVDETVTGNES